LIHNEQDDGLTITITQEFLDDLKQIILEEKKIQEDMSAMYSSLGKRLSKNHERLAEWESKLDTGISLQTRLQ